VACRLTQARGEEGRFTSKRSVPTIGDNGGMIVPALRTELDLGLSDVRRGPAAGGWPGGPPP